MPVCKICGIERTDLHRHLEMDHQMSSEQYKTTYEDLVVDSSVEEKRKETCTEKYGNPNYKNEEGKRLSFGVYEGGHPFSDPTLRAKACETKEELYGDPNFTNREKAKETVREKYGIESGNVAHIPGVVEKRVQTCIQRYGKVFNLERKDIFSKEQLEDLHYKQGLSMGEIGAKFGQTAVSVIYWMKKHGLKVNKKIVSPKTKEYSSNKDEVKEYFDWCLQERRVLAFSEYGKLTADKKNQKLKRLFNSGKTYHHLLQELKDVALKPDLWPEFLNKIPAGKVSY